MNGKLITVVIKFRRHLVWNHQELLCYTRRYGSRPLLYFYFCCRGKKKAPFLDRLNIIG